MKAQFKKTKKNVQMSFEELWNHADKVLGDGFMYVRAPYSMAKDEFIIHYGKYFVRLPSLPTADDLREGITGPMGNLLVKFWKA